MAMTSSTTSGKKTLFFRDTRDHQEHDTKNRLSIPAPSSEKPLAEIIPLKKKLTLDVGTILMDPPGRFRLRTRIPTVKL